MTEAKAGSPAELHLIGKAAAGKSALLRALTGKGRVGDGLRATTAAVLAVDLPDAAAPVLRLVDHPPLGANLPALPRGAAVLAVARLDDPVQAPLAAALRGLGRRDPGFRVLVALTGADRIPDPAARARVGAAIRAELARAAGGPLPWVDLDLAADPPDLGPLIAALGELLPAATARAFQRAARAAEAAAFEALRPLVWQHAAAAGAADLLPVVGALGVPAAQAALLVRLARAMGQDWTPARAGMFASALGAGVAVRFGLGHALRQGAKLIPVVGQTVGAAAAGAASGAATFALARAAHAWLWDTARGQAPDPAGLRALYAQALRDAAVRARG